jgi:hypothetical protein
MFIKPCEGRRVLRPDTKRPLPPEGIEVPDGDVHILFWARREAQGDVTIVADELTTPADAAPVPADAKE